MNRLSGSLSFLAALAMAGLASCAATPAALPADPVVSAATSAPRQARRQPLRMELRGQQDGARTLVDLLVEVQEALPGKPEIRFHLPEGASLEDGRAMPLLRAPDRPGRQSFRFALKDVQGTIRVTADLETPGYGYHSEAQWPPRAVPPAVDPIEIEIPPTTLHGIRIDQAIPLDPAPEAPAR